MRRKLLAAGAGVVAVAVALAAGELMAGLFEGATSLVAAVGSILIPLVPPALETWAIETFGTSDKFVLNTGTVVIALAIGAYAGIAGARRFRLAVTTFATVAALGLLAAIVQPLTSPLLVVTSIVVSAGAGLLTLRGLLRLLAPALRPEGTGPAATDPVRRRFLGAVAGAATAAIVMATVGRLLVTGRGSVDDVSLAGITPVRRLPPPSGAQAFSEVAGLSPVVTPNPGFYRIDTALTVPRIDPDSWTMQVGGMVDREVELTYGDLLDMELVEAYVTLSCVSNEVGGDLVDTAEWLGVRLVDVLDLAGVQPGASQIVGRAVDGWTAGFPTAVGTDGRDALVAVGMNGEPLPREHGFPARLVVPGLYGYVSATKWLTEIELTTWEAFDAYWVPRGWAKEGPVRTQSRIDVPRRGADVPAGEVVLAGVAWAPHRGVDAVELSLDGGPWRRCELTEPLSIDAWVQWRFSADLGPGEHTAVVRATDGTGALQTAVTSAPRPDGATGHHRVRFRTT